MTTDWTPPAAAVEREMAALESAATSMVTAGCLRAIARRNLLTRYERERPLIEAMESARLHINGLSDTSSYNARSVLYGAIAAHAARDAEPRLEVSDIKTRLFRELSALVPGQPVTVDRIIADIEALANALARERGAKP